MFIKDLETGKLLIDTAEQISGITWANDSKTLFYTVDEQSGRSYQVFRHILGNSPTSDELVFQEDDQKFYAWTFRSRSNEFILFNF